MEAGYVWDSAGATPEGAAPGKALTVIVRPAVDASPNRDLAGGIVRFGLTSAKGRVDAHSAGGIVRFGFGSDGH